MSLPLIAGLYPYTRGGVTQPPVVTLQEIPASLRVNPRYRERLQVLAGDHVSAAHLERLGLKVRRVFDDAPEWVHHDAAHLMKHWMCRWALTEFGECLWVDWDTVCLREPDAELSIRVRSSKSPRFIRIPNYRATVNCGVYYAHASWAVAMERSFEATVSEPNDELLWREVLPADVTERPEFWWSTEAVHVETFDQVALVQPDSYFAHVKRLDWAGAIRVRANRAPSGGRYD